MYLGHNPSQADELRIKFLDIIQSTKKNASRITFWQYGPVREPFISFTLTHQTPPSSH